MKLKIYILSAALIICSFLLQACISSQTEEETSTEDTTENYTEETFTQETTVPAEPVTVEKNTDAANPVPHKPASVTEAAPREPSSSAQKPYSSEPQIIGISSKGYDIVEKNGLTYVDGILIANKTYSLPSGYNPGGLIASCVAAFNEMESDASAQGLNIYISSGFRSYSTQANLYKRYCARDGKAAADRYSARPGHSEHQTGLAIDLNTIEYSFADTAEGKWVAENCWKYGFILRYPQDKEAQTGYRYEPWHIRYVGKDVAAAVFSSGLCLEEYLGIASAYK